MSAIVTVTALPFVGLLVIAALVAGFLTASHGISAMLGGLAVLIPNGVFAFYAFRYGGARNAQSIVRSFYLGEALKLVSVAILLTVIFTTYQGLKPGAAFSAMLAMMVGCGISATRLKTKLPTRRF